MGSARQRGLRQAIESELEENLLPFWRERSLDETTGGFIAEMSNDGIPAPNAAKGLILNTRLLWTFSTLFSARSDDRDLALARRAYQWLETTMRDARHGGYLWRVAADGRPLDSEKKVYGQAFAIYALSAFALAASEPEAADSARELFRLIETHARDEDHGGYIEARAGDWSEASELRLSAKDMAAAKSMNTHLHLLEAYTGLYRIWPDERVARRVRDLIGLFDRHILDSGRRHLSHFFDAEWNVLSDTCTYGHDIEAAWLLCKAAEILDDRELVATVSGWAESIARSVAEEALDGNGGLAYEGRNGEIIDSNREWWCQAEAVVGFWQAFEITGERRFAEAATGVWTFIERHVVDRAQGDWFWRIRADGTVDSTEPKISEWKGPYHSVRMCLEMLSRLNNDTGGSR